MPVVVITGLRQSGKTTFLQHEFPPEKRRFITFDDFAQLSAAKADPDRFVSTGEDLTIDEAHKCPEIFTAIKRVVDKKRRPGHFLLSGSANFMLLKGITESLAGRSVYFEMRPFTRREINERVSEPSFLERFLEEQTIPARGKFKPIESSEVLNGGMPSICLGPIEDRTFWFKGYEQTYLERDIREISQIENIIAYRNLLHLACLRTAQILNLSQLGRDAKLSSVAASRQLSLLETSFILSKLNPYLRNKASRLIKSPKIYISDSGLTCYMAGIHGFQATAQEPLFGALFETYVAKNLVSIVGGRWKDAGVYFWSVQGRHEVDFVIEAGRNCLAVVVTGLKPCASERNSGLCPWISFSHRILKRSGQVCGGDNDWQ